MAEECPCTECAALAARSPGPPPQAVLTQVRAHQGDRHRSEVALLLESRVWLKDLTARDRRAWQRYAPGFIPALEKLLGEYQHLLPQRHFTD